MSDTRQAVMSFLSDICPNDQARASLTEDTPLLDEGILDSFGVVRLVQFIEEEFKVRVPDGDIDPAMYATGAAIVGYIEQLRTSA